MIGMLYVAHKKCDHTLLIYDDLQIHFSITSLGEDPKEKSERFDQSGIILVICVIYVTSPLHDNLAINVVN